MGKKKIIWTPTSIETFEEILAYLQKYWTEKEIIKFVENTELVIHYISEKPLMFRKTNKKNIREALVTEHNLLIYKIYTNHIALITFWDTRKNPRKKNYKA